MTTLFSDLLSQDSTNNRSNVSSVNNDVSSIKVNLPSDSDGTKPDYLTSPEAFGGYWDSYEMGVTYEAVLARWEQAQTPEAKAAVLANVVERAVLRADLDVVDGKVRMAMVEGADDWHGLGTRFSDNPTGLEMLIAAGLEREVLKQLVQCGGIDVDGVFALGREIDGVFQPFPKISVGSGYEVVQDSDVMEFLDESFKTAGARYSSAGAINGGQTSFWCVEMPEHVEVVPGDEVFSFMTVSNSHGLRAIKAFGGNIRPVCANTHRQALQRSKSGLSFRHTKNVKNRMAQAANAINAQQEAFAEFGEKAKVMAQTQSNPRNFAQSTVDLIAENAYFQGQYLTTQQRLAGVTGLAVEKDVTPDQVAKEFRRREKKTDSFIANVLEKYSSDTNTAEGTVWSTFNSVTEVANHGINYRGTTEQKRESRFESLLTGRAAVVTDAAMEVATAAIGG